LGRDGLSVASIHEHRTAPGTPRRLHITPAVADEKAGAEVEPPPIRGGQQHARLWFAAVAAVSVVVKADRDVVQRQGLTQLAVHLVHGVGGESAARDVGLVRDHDQDEAGGAQTLARTLDARQDLQFLEAARGPWNTLANARLDEHAVPVEEDGGSAHPDRCACVSATSESSDSRSASREERVQRQPRPLILSTCRRTTGTSPRQPRSPPVNSYSTASGVSPTASTARSAISATVISSPVATL